MRSFMRMAVVAAALSVVVPAIHLQAAPAPAAAVAVTWTTIPVTKLPMKVRQSLKKAFPKSKVTKAEKSGTGASTQYRVTQTGAKKKVAIFDQNGKLVG